MTTISSVDNRYLFSGLAIGHRVTTHPQIPEAALGLQSEVLKTVLKMQLFPNLIILQKIAN